MTDTGNHPEDDEVSTERLADIEDAPGHAEESGESADDTLTTCSTRCTPTQRLSRRSVLLGVGGVGLLASGVGLGNAREARVSSTPSSVFVQSAAALSQSTTLQESAHAFGNGARAVHEGAFVIADSSPQSFSSKQPDEVRTQMPIYAPAFNTTSARAAKTDLDPVDPRTILEGVEDLPIHTWRFADNSTHGDDVRHIGPMAEDFHDAFDLDGPDDAIATVDADGVALAAIKGLLDRLESDNRYLEEELDERRERLVELESQLADIEAGVAEE